MQQERGVRSWSFEAFEDDVVHVAGEAAQRRLDGLATAPLFEWVDQLASMLDAYFTALEPPTTESEL